MKKFHAHDLACISISQSTVEKNFACSRQPWHFQRRKCDNLRDRIDSQVVKRVQRYYSLFTQLVSNKFRLTCKCISYSMIRGVNDKCPWIKRRVKKVRWEKRRRRRKANRFWRIYTPSTTLQHVLCWTSRGLKETPISL